MEKHGEDELTSRDLTLRNKAKESYTKQTVIRYTESKQIKVAHSFTQLPQRTETEDGSNNADRCVVLDTKLA